MNVLTFDVEEWFHLLDFSGTDSAAQWNHYQVRIYDNVERILHLLEDTNSKATFFVIGWVAKKYPDLVRRIADHYEVGSHTMNHRLVWQQTPQVFREDVKASIHLLEDITGKKVRCFRAPGFSIRESEAWAFDTLSELGIEIDCSVFPARHAHGGMPSYGEAKPSLIRHGSVSMKEFPITKKMMLGKPLIFTGGGYFRLCPYSLIRHWSKALQGQYMMLYIHPRDLDAGQPLLEGLPMSRRFKSYVGLRRAEDKLRCWLQEFPFTDIATVDNTIDWNTTPIYHIQEKVEYTLIQERVYGSPLTQ